jgi:hypothetical protein
LNLNLNSILFLLKALDNLIPIIRIQTVGSKRRKRTFLNLLINDRRIRHSVKGVVNLIKEQNNGRCVKNEDLIKFLLEAYNNEGFLIEKRDASFEDTIETYYLYTKRKRRKRDFSLFLLPKDMKKMYGLKKKKVLTKHFYKKGNLDKKYNKKNILTPYYFF